jgi:hypothetical protein
MEGRLRNFGKKLRGLGESYMAMGERERPCIVEPRWDTERRFAAQLKYPIYGSRNVALRVINY